MPDRRQSHSEYPRPRFPTGSRQSLTIPASLRGHSFERKLGCRSLPDSDATQAGGPLETAECGRSSGSNRRADRVWCSRIQGNKSYLDCSVETVFPRVQSLHFLVITLEKFRFDLRLLASAIRLLLFPERTHDIPMHNRRHFVFRAAILGGNVFAESEEDRVSQTALLGPFRKPHMHDDSRFRPAGFLVRLRHLFERTLGAPPGALIPSLLSSASPHRSRRRRAPRTAWLFALVRVRATAIRSECVRNAVPSSPPQRRL